MRSASILLLSLGMQFTWASGAYVHGHVDRSLEQAVRTGTDTNGRPLYLCLANLFNSLQPGKTWAGYGRCNVAYGGKEYIVNEFKVPPRSLFRSASWQRNTANPLKVGRDTNGKPLFLCQALFKGSKQPGKTWPGYRHCNISYAGKEIVLPIFQIMSDENSNQHSHNHSHNNHNHNHRPTQSQVMVTEYN